MLRRFLCLMVFLTLGLSSWAQRVRLNFDSGWLLSAGDFAGASEAKFDDSGWNAVTLPHAWNEDYAYRVSIHDQPTGIAWYRKHFRLPPSTAYGKVFIEFEGVRQAAEVYLNGHRLGLSENGVMAFGFDLTPFLVAGDNVIAVRTDNRWDYREQVTHTTVQWNNNNFYSNFGGINKRVWLHLTPAVYQTLPLYSSFGTTGVYVWADQFDLKTHSASIHVESQVRNESGSPAMISLQVRVLDATGALVATGSSTATSLSAGHAETLTTQIPGRNLHFWSWGYGYLYRVETTVMLAGRPVDTVSTRTGFRDTAFHDGMLFLNGRVLEVHGYAARSTNEWPALGTDVPPWVSDFSNGLMVQDNADLVRWMHVTPAKQDIESTDRVGLPVSMPAGDAEGDAKGRQWQARLELMRDSIVYNRNDPSILFYESGNKGVSDEHMKEMLTLKNEFDPHGGRASGSREMLSSHVAEYGGEMLYIDKSATKPLWAHEYNRDEGARKFWNDETPPYHQNSPLYNRNQDSFTLEDVLRWDDYYRARPGTGKRVSAGGVNISWIDENSHFRGDNNYRRSGEVDAMRIPKDAFFAHQVMWDGWVEPEHHRIHITGHWNYKEGTVRTVYVIANSGGEVELKLNGRSLGRQRPTSDFLYTFPAVAYHSGTLQADAYDLQGKVVAHTEIQTAGPAARVRLTPHTAPGGIHADGSDLALVDVEVVDAADRRVPTALNLIHFHLQGPAEWRGGIAQGSAKPVPENTTPVVAEGMAATPLAPLLHQDNYILSQSLPVEGGVNRVSVRSTSTPGTITLVADSDGVVSAKLTLTTKAVPQESGLSSFDPSADLPLSLERGPTPAGPSFHAVRRAVAITGATAGVNELDVAKSFDDDETTAWTNASVVHTDVDADGYTVRHAPPDQRPIQASLQDAWIQYTLSQPELLTAVDIKLGSFRLRRYPLRITLDGEVVFEGLTPTSLGYVTLPLNAKRPGTKLRIELSGPPINVQEGQSLVEVNGKIDQADATGKPLQPVLSVQELEAYAAK